MKWKSPQYSDEVVRRARLKTRIITIHTTYVHRLYAERIFVLGNAEECYIVKVSIFHTRARLRKMTVEVRAHNRVHYLLSEYFIRRLILVHLFCKLLSDNVI